MRRTDHQAGGEIQGNSQIHLGKAAMPQWQEWQGESGKSDSSGKSGN